MTATPASNTLGTATITLVVSDGALSASNSFILIVNPATLTVTENSVSRVVGALNPALTGSITGLQSGDLITANFWSPATTNSPAGGYPIEFTLSDPGSKLGNYIVTTNNGTLTVTPPGPPAISRAVFLDASHLQLTGMASPNSSCIIQMSADLVTWVNLGAATTDAAGSFQIIDSTAAAAPIRFYRAANP